jgi:hypothetical protein
MAARYVSNWQAAAEASSLDSPRSAATPAPDLGATPLVDNGLQPVTGAAEATAAAAPGIVADVVPRKQLEVALAQLGPAEASKVRNALQLPALGASSLHDAGGNVTALRHDSLISSGPVAFGAVYDALQAAAQTLAAEPAQSWRNRAVLLSLAPFLLLLTLLLAACLFVAGLRYGRAHTPTVIGIPGPGVVAPPAVCAPLP